MFENNKCKIVGWLQSFDPVTTMTCKLLYWAVEIVKSWLIFAMNLQLVHIFFLDFLNDRSTFLNWLYDTIGYSVPLGVIGIGLTLTLKVIAHVYRKTMFKSLNRFEIMSCYSFGQLKKSTFFKDQLKSYNKHSLIGTYNQYWGDLNESISSQESIIDVMRLSTPEILLHLIRIGPLILLGLMEWYYYGPNWITGATIMGMILAGLITAMTIRIVRKMNQLETVFLSNLRHLSEQAWATGIAILFDNGIIQNYQQEPLIKKDLYDNDQAKLELMKDSKIDAIQSIYKPIYKELKTMGQIYFHGLACIVINAIVSGMGIVSHRPALLLGMIILQKIYQVLVNGNEKVWINSCNRLYDASGKVGVLDQQERFANSIASPYKQPQTTIPQPKDIQIQDLHFDINNKQILKGVSFTLKKQEHKILLGCNGAGKTTLMNVLAGGYEYNNETQQWKHSDFLLLSQEPSILVGTVEKNVFLNLESTDELLAELEHFKNQLNLTVPNQLLLIPSQNTLSGGEKKKLELLRAYFYLKYNTYKSVLLVDEILANLDPASRTVCEKFLMENFKNHSMIIITHEPKSYEHVNSCMILSQGKIVTEGTFQDIKETPYYREYTEKL